MSAEPQPGGVPPNGKKRIVWPAIRVVLLLVIVAAAAALWLFISTMTGQANPWQAFRYIRYSLQVAGGGPDSGSKGPPAPPSAPPQKLIMPPSTPVVVRGGSVKAYCRGCAWSPTTNGRVSTRPAAPTTIYLEDIDFGNGDLTIDHAGDWKITLIFRDSGGKNPSHDPEVFTICTHTDGHGACAALDSQGPRPTVYLLGYPNGNGFADDEIDNPRAHYNRKSDCVPGDHGPTDAKCNHIHTIQIDEYQKPQRTFHCIDGECGIGIDQ